MESAPDTQLFRDVFNASPIGIAVENLDGEPLFVNPAFCSMLGFSEEELRRKHCFDFSPPDDAERDWALFQQLRAGSIDHYQLEKRYFRRDGSLVWGRLSISLLTSRSSPLVLAMVKDITDKKNLELERNRKEEALRVGEERFRLAQSAACIGTFEWNIRTGVNTWTPELEAMYGLPAGGFGGTQTTFENLVHPDDRARVIELVDRSLKTGQSTKGEWRVVWPDGSVHWIAGRWQAFMDESGEPLRVIGVNVDVTQHNLAEQELARANERLQLAIESGSVGGWDFDIKTGKNMWFGKAHAQLGMTPDETSGSLEEFWVRVHKDDRERLEHALRIAKDRSEDFAAEFRVVWRDGTIHWLRSRGRYRYAANGKPERMLGISVDITQSKQVEQALRESEQRFRLATQAGKMYSFDWDVTTGAVLRSPEHAKILGVTEPLRFTHQQFLDQMHPDDRQKLAATIAGLTPENPTAVVTYRMLSSDGALVWLRSSGRAFFDGQGRMLRVIGMVADVTDLKRAEEALLGINRRLIEAQEQERSRIGRELHDDINQKVALLAVNLQTLKQDLPAFKKRTGRQIVEICERVANLGSDIQALSHRLHSSKLEYLGLEAAAASFCKEFSMGQNAETTFHSENIPKEISADAALCLFRVLQEALQNAAKHSGVKRFEVWLKGNLNEIQLTVHDSGVGFDAERVMNEHGLGLTSMRERLKLVGGQLSIDSKLVSGTTIHARVPLSPKVKSAGADG